jgi:hypothetical protein
MPAVELTFVIAGFAIQIIGLVFIAVQVRQTNRDVRYVADLQAAILLRTDRTDKTVTDIKALLQK